MSRNKTYEKALPQGWREVRLGEVCAIDKESLASKTPSEYCFKYISLSDIEKRRLIKTQKYKFAEAPSRARRVVEQGDVLLSTVRPNLQGFYIFKDEVKDHIVSTGFAVLSAKKHLLVPSYLYQVLFSPYMLSIYYAFNVGSNYPAINSSDIHSFRIFIPPLPEQKAIASLLETWDTAIEKTEALIAAKEKQFEWLLKRLINQVEQNVESQSLGSLIKFIDGYPFKNSGYHTEGHYNILTIANVQNGYMTDSFRNKVIEIPVQIRKAQILNMGDILISMTGNVGRVCTVSIPNCLLNQRVGKLIPTATICSDYLYFSLFNRKFLHSMIACAQGGAQGNLSKKDIIKYRISAPSLPEQKRIVEALNTYRREIDLLKKLTEQYRTQKRGLLQKLLTGKWRIKK